MTLEEKVSLCHGGSDFGTKAIPRLSIPEYRFTDGPNGVRDQEQAPTTYFPTGISMAATWDPELIQNVGVALGEECKTLGKSVLLGPAVNIDLTPLGGRSFEYESEDPFLNARICVGYINGVQSQNVVSCVKHYAVNSIEKERTTVDAQPDERTLREIYLPAFEAAITEAHAGSIMAAYNKLNGQYCAENTHLLKDILKDEWGFKGFAMSDWGAVHSTVPTALNGLDLEMPGGDDNYLGAPLLRAVQDGKVPVSDVDEMATRTLTTLQGKDLSNFTGKPNASTQDHEELARKVAEEAMVLLKNSGQNLPLDAKKIRTLAVIGPNANVKFGGRGGSGSVIAPYEVTPLAGLRGYLGASVDVRYAAGEDTAEVPLSPIPQSVLTTPSGEPGLRGDYYANVDSEGQPSFSRIDPNVHFNWDRVSPQSGFTRENFSVKWSGFLTPATSGDYELALASDDGSRFILDGQTVIDNWGYHGVVNLKGFVHLEKGHRYPVEVDFFQGDGGASVNLAWKMLPGGRKPWIDKAADLAAHSDKAILVVGCTHEEDTEGSDKNDLEMPNDQDELVRAVLKAKPDTVVVLINGTPIAMPWVGQAKSILEAWYPGLEGGNALARVLFGDVAPSGKLPLTFPVKLSDSPAHALGDYPPKNGVFKYDEGVLVGYRWYDTKNIEPLFPFGHGLSYTTFRYDKPAVTVNGQEADVTVRVTNTGSRDGAEVVQVYVSEPGAKVERPAKELKGFAKVFLHAGESKEAAIHLNRRSFAYYSVDSKSWVVDGGAYKVLVGSSSRDIRGSATADVKGD
jgi:beta-glucosidase